MSIGTRFRRPFVAAVRGLRRSLNGQRRRAAELSHADYLPSDQLEAASMQRLRRLLRHAFENVPYYARLARERGVCADDFRQWTDLSRLPVLTKDDIRAHSQDIRATSGPSTGVRENHTGGSTGEPLYFVQDQQYREQTRANRDRLFSWCGATVGGPRAFLWGSPPDAVEHETFSGRMMDAWLRNWLWINTYQMTEESLASSYDELIRFDPEIIIAYRSSAVLFARFILQASLPAPRSVRGLQSSAEVLTSGDRLLIEDAFGCEVFDRYGCRELGVLAHECPAHSGLHTFPLANIVEVVDDEGSPLGVEQTGRVVVTNLWNYAMPFIRYATGDLAVAASSKHRCACGRTGPLINSIAGREWDTIVTPSGRLVCGGFFEDYLFEKDCSRDYVKQLQVVQERLDHLRIDLVPLPGTDTSTFCDEWREWIHEHCDPDLTVTFNVCTSIDTGRSGKLRYAVSKVNHRLKKRARQKDRDMLGRVGDHSDQ